ncbi:MAG TPA: tRNA (adenosine(37)-N6)-dimethylallyltransferase MiaA [Syntrophomonadaceae bacterium]|nr:tRNA (adenosine(37)-N6)-dimethylallyltransferase MiaA [Syntrophomonadaceae bacterium]
MLNLGAIVGPTAVGKTELSLCIAQELGAEIISCDSTQVYRGMDIGTAKATLSEREMVAHHLIDIKNPDQYFSVADYQRKAKQIIRHLNEKNILPILVGGTGLYYQAVVDNYVFYPLETKHAIKDKWKKIINEKGLEYAYEYLKQIDPEYAIAISGNDQRRIVRAIEVYELTNKPFSSMQEKKINTYNLASIGLNMNRTELYSRINKRVLHMLNNGLLEEVIKLRKNGYNVDLKSMQSLGYIQVAYYLDGFLTKEQMIKEIQRETRRFAKRQLTWFRKDKKITWFELDKNTDKRSLTKKILRHMEGQLCIV